MSGLDTNVLVRYLTQDDPDQCRIVDEEIEMALSEGKKLLIQPIVLCELVWVLESAYGYRKSEILTTLDQIMRTVQFEIMDKDILWRALDDYRKHKGDFSDHYIGQANKKSGARLTLTFDKALIDNPLFKVLSG